MKRTYPAQAARAPAHRLRPGETADRGFQNLGDDRRRLAARLDHHREIDMTLLVVADLQLVFRQPGRAQEPFQRRIGRRRRRSLALFAHRRAFRRQPMHRKRQPSRRRKGSSALIGQPRLHQSVRHQLLQILTRTGLHPRRDFLGKEFDEKVGHLIGPRFRSAAARHRPGHRDRPPQRGRHRDECSFATGRPPPCRFQGRRRSVRRQST